MARRICSALALGGRSCYRDWHDIPVASERVANLEITPNQRLARLGGPDCFARELLQLFDFFDKYNEEAQKREIRAKHGFRLFSMLNTVNAEKGGIAEVVQVNQSCGRNRRTAA